jgi:putative membrane protein
VSAKYFLDGQEVAPEKIKGATGELRVEYTVTNTTGSMETISYVDAAGETVTKEVMIYTPLAGSFSTVLPDSFSHVASKEGAVAADGRGRTKAQWSLTLLPPLSTPSATFGYTADIVNGELPEANLSIIPVRPYDNPTASSAVASYTSGAKSGSDLYAGGVKLDDGLQQLADGAGQLMAGLAKLSTGADQLSAGLGTADQGANDLAAGADKLNAGAAQLAAGNAQLAGGLSKLEDGINTLEEKQAFQQIIAGLQKISAGVGDPGSWAVDATGTPADLNSALNYIAAGVDNPAGDFSTLPQEKYGVMEALQAMRYKTAASQSQLAPLVSAAPSTAAGLSGYAGTLSAATKVTVTLPDGSTKELNKDELVALLNGSQQYVGAIGQVNSGMNESLGAYDQLINRAIPQLAGGLAKVQTNVNGIGDGADALTVAVQTVYAALAGDMANGVRDLSTGADALSIGATTLAAGTDQLAGGAASLADGTGKLAAGATQLADGLVQANGAGPAMAAGIDKLSAEGAQKIAESGMATQLKYEEYVAQVAAAAQRTTDGALPAGAPADAEVATAAYSFDIAGTDDAGMSPAGLALLAAGLFGAAGIGTAIRSRRNG